MKTEKWEKIPNTDMNCFGCGSENHHGLKMTFERNKEKIRSIVMVPDHLMRVEQYRTRRGVVYHM